MRQRVIDRCWKEIESFWDFVLDGSPTDDEKKAHAYRETYGKTPEGIEERKDGFDNIPYTTWAKRWKTWHITEWIEDLSNMSRYGGCTISEIPEQYRNEIFTGAAKKVLERYGWMVNFHEMLAKKHRLENSSER